MHHGKLWPILKWNLPRWRSHSNCEVFIVLKKPRRICSVLYSSWLCCIQLVVTWLARSNLYKSRPSSRFGGYQFIHTYQLFFLPSALQRIAVVAYILKKCLIVDGANFLLSNLYLKFHFSIKELGSPIFSSFLIHAFHEWTLFLAFRIKDVIYFKLINKQLSN